MATAKVNPFQLREPRSEFLFDMGKRTLEHVCPTLAMAMAMETFNVARQRGGHLVGRNAEAGTWCARVIEFGLNFRILGVDTNAETQRWVGLPSRFTMTLVLAERIESEVARHTGDIGNFGIGICGRISVGWTSELFKGQTCLEERTSGGGADVLAEDGERLPQGIGFEGKDNLHSGLIGYSVDERQVTPQELFLQKIDRLVDLLESLSIYFHA